VFEVRFAEEPHDLALNLHVLRLGEYFGAFSHIHGAGRCHDIADLR